jgi:choline dehydrogenase-like flavoprotein
MTRSEQGTSGPVLDEADVVIVGTGAGGATAARVLTAAGLDVVLLEEGPRLRSDERPRELLDAMALAMRDMATQATRGKPPVALLQGRCVGGSTAINSGIVWRLPEDVRAQWIAERGLGEMVGGRELDDAFAVLEAELGIAETPAEVLGGNNTRMARGAEALGLPGRVIHRNVRGCRGESRCLQGCPHEARQSMDVSYVPRALEAGARLHTGVRVRRALLRAGRAVGVEAVRVDALGGARERVQVRARAAVVLAAGALHTPLLLLRTGLRRGVGDHFQAHPGCAVVGRFPEPVRMGRGATQGYEVPLRERRYKLEALALPPETLAARLPGVGAEWQERLGELDHYAQWCAQIRMEARGTVRLPLLDGPNARPVVRYQPTRLDVERAREAVALICRMMFAAGATEVFPGIARRPEVLRSPEEVRLIEEGDVDASDFHFMASHLFGTAGAHADARRGVVGPDLRVHGVDGLYVMDASALPTNLGVNPQHTIMGTTWRAAARLADRLSDRCREGRTTPGASAAVRGLAESNAPTRAGDGSPGATAADTLAA